ncbi:VWA domain-containing protein [Lysobacter sp. Root604]|uniref:vWA domain-containing protein n=1 Tax=Lysobacter sp. Root604 TaxID=1736568 RepID=UPI000AF624E1|nr:VWA domain-containing protein [Lysobacter sp. Root604]
MNAKPQPYPSSLLFVAVLSALALSACHTSTRNDAPSADKADARSERQTAQTAPSAADVVAIRDQAAGAVAAADAAKAAADSVANASVELPEANLSMRRAPGAPPPPPAPAMAYVTESKQLAPASTLEAINVSGSRMKRAQIGTASPVMAAPSVGFLGDAQFQPANTEKYAAREDNPVRRTADEPLSTFSIDVDTGSYSNVRRMLNQGVRPPADAVRAEEFINYFDYGHPAPTSRDTPFRVTTELAPAPWNAQRQLLMIGIKGYDVPKATLPPANLVFLIDTSGSMDQPDKLPLLKSAFGLLTKQLRPQDRISIVVYAGSAGLVLPPTPGDRQSEILEALDRLQAGGSTNGGDGIRLAYAMAKQAYVKDGVNRVILATDGDFNVGTVSQGALETLVADQRKSGIALTTLGFGQGNYNDALSEKLADVGDGNHAYIDTLQEARKVLVEEMGSTMLTIARDVKIQVEFNPALVSEYRLIGYENRVLKHEDFNNDKVDAGDIGAGHEVTALYELTPVGSTAARLPALRYREAPAAQAGKSGEIANLKLRYKRPGQDASRLIETPILRSQLHAQPGESMRFAAAVAAFADALRGGSRSDGWGWDKIEATARASKLDDRWGQRRELLQLIERARRQIAGDTPSTAVSVSE